MKSQHLKRRQVKLTKHIGFCFGVRRAVDIARRLTLKKQRVYCLGPLIHNPQVVRELSKRGLKVIDNLDAIKEGLLLIRSHGASPGVIGRAKKKKIRIIDATCPFVKRLHNKAKSLEKSGYKIVIVGDAGHPEIEALRGAIKDILVVSGAGALNKLSLKGKRVALLAQTTQSRANFKAVGARISKIKPKKLCVFDTICRDGANRQTEALKLAHTVDTMIVLGGRNSANTKRLAAICKKVCSDTYHIETEKELKPQWLLKKRIIGIASGASTPDWVIKGVLRKINYEGRE
ncbi:MAG: 4-hydroxy-3-methylbut-2-enyl diphosphate reductase [Candidatus Omnitrophota bacterium]